VLYIFSLDETKQVLGIDDQQDDELLAIWLEAIQGRLNTHCNRNFLAESAIEEIFDGGESVLAVQQWPIASVTSVHIDADQEWDSTTLLDSDDYILHAAGTLATNGQENDRQTLRRAFMLQASFEWRNREQLGISQVSSQGVTVQQGAQVATALKFQTLLPEVQTSLVKLVRV